MHEGNAARPGVLSLTDTAKAEKVVCAVASACG